jgi:hypothetical protein
MWLVSPAIDRCRWPTSSTSLRDHSASRSSFNRRKSPPARQIG